MSIQNDLDMVMDQLEELPPMLLGLYAYAAIRLLEDKCPLAVKNGSFDVCISDTPQYDSVFEREVPMELKAKISVSETTSFGD